MRIFYHQNRDELVPVETDLAPFDLRQSIEKTRQALEAAYSGFDNAVEIELIDSYIYEINSLQKRYEHLTSLASCRQEEESDALYQHSPIHALVSHVFS